MTIITLANTPKTVASQLRSALSQCPEGMPAFRLGIMSAAAEYAIKQLDQQLDSRDIAGEIDALRLSLMDHARCARRKAGEPAHSTSQLLGAIEAANMRLELLADRLEQSARPVYPWAESKQPAGSTGAA